MYFFSFLMVGNVVLKISSVLWCQVLVFWTSIVLFYTNTLDNLILYMEIKVTFFGLERFLLQNPILRILSSESISLAIKGNIKIKM